MILNGYSNSYEDMSVVVGNKDLRIVYQLLVVVSKEFLIDYL